MSRVTLGLAVAIGLLASAAMAQVESKPASDPGSQPEVAAKSVPASPGSRVSGSSSGPGGFQGGPSGFQGGPGGFQGGRGGPGGGPPGDASQSIDRILRQYDTNGDGVITPEEVAKIGNRLAKARFEGMMRLAGRAPGQPIKVTELRDALIQTMGQRGGPRGGGPGAPPEIAGGVTGAGQAPASSVPGRGTGSGIRPGPVSPRQPSGSPDPRAPMVTIQAVLVELVQDEPGAAAKKRPDAPAAESKPAPVLAGKSDLAVVDLDLTAPPETILAGLRKLGVQGRLDDLNRLQMTTLDKQSASVQFTRQEPMITGTTLTTFGQTNSVTFASAGLIVAIVPHVAEGGDVLLEIDLNQTRQGRPEEGVPISVSSAGQTIRSTPRISSVLRSTVKAPAGKTVVVAAASESGPRRTETVLLVSARVLNVKSD